MVLIEDPKGIERILVDHFKSTYESANTYTVENIMEQLHNLAIPQLSTQQCHFEQTSHNQGD